MYKFLMTGALALLSVSAFAQKKYSIPNIDFKNKTEHKIAVSRILYFGDKAAEDERPIGVNFSIDAIYGYTTIDKKTYFDQDLVKGKTKFNAMSWYYRNQYYKVGFFTVLGHNFASTDKWIGTALVIGEYLKLTRNGLGIEVPETLRQGAVIELSKNEWKNVIHLKKKESVSFRRAIRFYKAKSDFNSDGSTTDDQAVINSLASQYVSETTNDSTLAKLENIEIELNCTRPTDKILCELNN